MGKWNAPPEVHIRIISAVRGVHQEHSNGNIDIFHIRRYDWKDADDAWSNDVILIVLHWIIQFVDNILKTKPPKTNYFYRDPG